MIGRFVGARVLGRWRPGWVLAARRARPWSSPVPPALSSGWFACRGSCSRSARPIRVMFPTISRSGSRGSATGDTGGSALCTGIVGGALVPLASGLVADAQGLATALAVPLACYALILIYGLYSARSPNPVGPVAPR